jgi:hypothetical protein
VRSVNSSIPHSLMELIPSREAANCAATRELPSTLWNPEVHYRVHKSPPEPDQSNPYHPMLSSNTLILFLIWTNCLISGRSLIIITICEKGDKTECNKYRGISFIKYYIQYPTLKVKFIRRRNYLVSSTYASA